ncbi:hypothetical protein GA0070610_1851 [Micromonospora echinofusca]|uniref:Uncharacterized protein n=1 Tax=Micromonospora echinofusca TaxID=47858 RepID=A0A1C5G6S8_MICEH|nr:hypothetical protein GA0070610_1851 [Micromonospora echinofusca]
MRAVAQSGAAVAEVAQRRAEVLAKLDGEVRDATAAHELSVVVLATMLRDDALAAELSGLDVSKVRALRRTADGAAIRERVAQLGAVVPSRRGRPRAAANASPSGLVDETASAAGPLAGG